MLYFTFIQEKKIKFEEKYDKLRDKGKEFMDKGNEMLHKWEEKSKEFIGNFLDLFGREGKIVRFT